MLAYAQAVAAEGSELQVTLWLVGGGGLLAALLALVSYLLVWGRSWLEAASGRLAARMARWFPRRWTTLQRRLGGPARRGLPPLLLALGLTIAFGVVTEGWRGQGDLYAVDHAVNEALDGALPPPVVRAMRAVTHAGDVLTLVVVSGLVGLWLARRRAWTDLWALVFVVVGGQALVWGLKWVFGRDRPGGQLIDNVGESFPSGHAFSSTILYGFLVYLAWQWTGRTGLRAVITAALGLLVAGVCLSRILLSVHWVSDVLGGLLLGLAWLLVSVLLARVLSLPGSRSGLGRSTAPVTS